MNLAQLSIPRLWRRALGALVLTAAAGAVALAQLDVLVLDADRAAWDAVVAQAKGAGITATVKDYNEAALYNQVFLAGFGAARFDVAQALAGWTATVASRFADLSPYASQLQGAGLELYSYGGRVIGVVLPWRKDAFASVSTRSTRVSQAVQLLGFLPAGGTAGATATGKALPLTIGSITITKTERGNPHVDGALETFLEAARQAVPQGVLTALAQVPAPARDALTRVAEMLGIPLSPAGEVTLVVESKGGGPVPMGLAVEATTSPLGLSKVTVPLAQLESFLAQVGAGVYVRLPYTPHPMAVTSEGAALVGAGGFHAAGVRGSGVKIAVIDLGFNGLSAAQAQGDLPYSVITRDFTGTGIATGLSHGTAVAQIVYDIAPDAQLYLIKIGNEVDLDNAVSYCISEGVHVVNHSLGWFNTNFYDGTGTIAEIARRATGAGILWVQAAGNSAQKHYGATFTDGNGDGWHDTDVTFTAQAGQQIVLYLTWDAWPATADDYDLYLYGPTGALVASSTATQGGTEQPTERVSTTAGAAGTYRVRIQKASGAARRLSLFSIVQNVTPAVPASSIPAPGNAAEVLTVGAINWSSYATGPIAPYSSRGPTGDGRSKPDLAAPDNVTTGVGTYNPFPGTSAAAPHAAGIAALIKAENPGLTRAALTSRILSFCVPMGDPNAFGAGRLEARPQAVSRPDLVVDSVVYAPSSPAVGSTVSFTVVVRNQGSAPASEFKVRLQGAGPSYHERTVSSLAPGATTTLYFSMPLSTSPETFTATADALNQVPESDETNNTRQVVVTAPAQADLVIQSITHSPTSPTLGSTVTFQVTVRNQGAAAAGAFTVRLQGVGPSQDQSVSSLAAGASTTRTFTLPLSTSPETFTATADVFNQVAESDETNNTGTRVVTAPAQADLVIESFTHSPANPPVGSSVTFTVVVRNQGTAPAGAFVIRVSRAGASGDASVSSLAAGATATRTVTLTTTASPQTFTATVDATNQVAESDEGNNTAQVTVTAPAQADLVVDAITWDPPNPGLGSTVTFTVTVRNQGAGAAGAFTVRLQGVGPSQDQSVSSLGAGASVTRTFTLPLSTSPETFTATADVFNQVAESSEGNNTRQVTLTGVSPLAFTVATDKSVYTVGEAVRITVTLSRQSYLYLIELDAAGRAILVFPNWRDANNQVPAGTTQFPRSTTYAFITSEPVGSEQIVGFAADRQVPYFPTSYPAGYPILSTNGALFLSQVRSWLSANVPAGSWAEASAPFTIQAAPNQPPTASFTFSPASPLVNQWITFDGRASTDPDGTIVSWAWNFGDGATGTGSQIQKRYSAAGTYTVTLTVTDNRGATASTSRMVTVVTPNQPPTASFTFSPTNPDPGQNVTFDASASSDPDGTIVSYAWSFGDGTTGTGVNVTKAYASAGTYTVTLTVTDNLGATGTTTRTIQVGTPPPPPPTLPGMPVIDRPGIYVWGDAQGRWHVTVAGSAPWASARPFRVSVSTNGTFTALETTPATAPAPTLSNNNRNLLWQGTIQSGWVDLRFAPTGSGSWLMLFELYLDLDGDGDPRPRTPAEARSMVFLRAKKVQPPYNPFLVLTPVGEFGAVQPGHDFRIAQGDLFVHVVTTTIRELEGDAP